MYTVLYLVWKIYILPLKKNGIAKKWERLKNKMITAYRANVEIVHPQIVGTVVNNQSINK